MNFEKISSDQDQSSEERPERQSDLADEDQPHWAPPESQPEPRPTEPVLDEPLQTSPTPN